MIGLVACGSEPVVGAVSLQSEVASASGPAVPLFGDPLGGVFSHVQVGAPGGFGDVCRIRSWCELAKECEVGLVSRSAVRAGYEEHGWFQCPTAAAPFSPTRAPERNRSIEKGLIRSGVRLVAIAAAICSPDTGPALYP